jgi:hypothetical protein
MNRTVATVGIALAAWLALSGIGTASPRVAAGTEVFKGPADPAGSIRFQVLESKRGVLPRLDRFHLKFDCNDGLGLTGAGYGAAPGSSVRPDRKGRFGIDSKGRGFSLTVRGDFNRGFTKASGTFRFRGDLGDGMHTDCDTGRVSWRAAPKP